MSIFQPVEEAPIERPVIVLSPGMYRLKRAYHIDPLLAAMVVIQQPSGLWGRSK